jgi:hypothetical protein
MNNTHMDDDRMYWHVSTFREGRQLVLRRSSGKSRVDLTANRVIPHM